MHDAEVICLYEIIKCLSQTRQETKLSTIQHSVYPTKEQHNEERKRSVTQRYVEESLRAFGRTNASDWYEEYPPRLNIAEVSLRNLPTRFGVFANGTVLR